MSKNPIILGSGNYYITETATEMGTPTNCPNCGAVVDLHMEKCAYCDTPYTWTRSKAPQESGITPGYQYARLLECGVLSPNEVRRALGILYPSACFDKEIVKER